MGGGISHNEDALFSEVYCCLILNHPTPIEIWLWKLVVRALVIRIILVFLFYFLRMKMSHNNNIVSASNGMLCQSSTCVSTYKTAF